jgi:hypothetical protein
MLKKERDIKGVISKEKRFSTLAKKEGKTALKAKARESKAGMKEQAKDSAHEAKVAFMFARKRKEIANKEAKKLK